jgi:hypothetical protein
MIASVLGEQVESYFGDLLELFSFIVEVANSLSQR